MVKLLESSILKNMTLTELKKHAKHLRRSNYPISGYSVLTDSPEDMKTLRKMIRHAQKAGNSSSSSPKLSSPDTKIECDPEFENITHCQKKTSSKKVKQLAEDCGIDIDKYGTKPEQCAQLIKAQGGKKHSKKHDNSIKQTDAYKKLNKMKKKDSQNPDLQDKAKKLGIDYGNQDGENISMMKLRKHELIMAILEKKGKLPSSPKKKSSKKKTPSPKKKSSKKKTPSPKKKSSKKKTPSPKSSPKYPKKKCAGKKYKKLMKMGLKELKDVMYDAGLKHGLPKSKKGMVDYLCATEENGRCDPEKGVLCDDEFVCDASNNPGVCVSPDQASQHGGDLNTWEYNGKKIVGTYDAINALKLALKPKKKKLPDPWSKKGLERKKLINQVSLATGRPKKFFADWSTSELKTTIGRTGSSPRNDVDKIQRTS